MPLPNYAIKDPDTPNYSNNNNNNNNNNYFLFENPYYKISENTTRN